MKKASKTVKTEMQDEYDFSGGVRGKYVHQFQDGSNIVVLSPDVAKAFPDSKSVNEALRMLIQIAQHQTNTTTQH
jgi:hypothetical protein